MALLDLADPIMWRAAGTFIRAHAENVANIVECFSVLHSTGLLAEQGVCPCSIPDRDHCTARCKSVLDQFHTPNGGYARARGEPASLYHTFLGILCEQMLGLSPLGPPIRTLLRKRLRADGGYSDLGQTERGETNPTAAAVALLKIFGALEGENVESTAEFLATMQRADGGFAAHQEAPASDLLSTFTALVSLADLNRLRCVNLASVGRFVRALASEHGGVRGSILDNEPDVEYTYYGLGVLGLLALTARHAQRERGNQ